MLFYSETLVTAIQTILMDTVYSYGMQNIDIQYIADPYSCIMYVLSYVMKCENGMSEILKRVAKEFKDETVQKQMKQVLYQFANKREVFHS